MIDGKLVRQKVKLDDNTITQFNEWLKEHPDNKPVWKSPLHENQQYWADRWADQMNYPYWTDRCLAEMPRSTARALASSSMRGPRRTSRPTSRSPSPSSRKGWTSGIGCSSVTTCPTVTTT